MAILWDSYVSPAALTAFVRAVPVDQNFILNQLLPDRVDDVLDVEISAETQVTTRAAKVRAWDAPPMPGRRDSFVTRKVRLPAISQFLGRGERDRLDLERLRSGGQSTKAIEQAIYDDAENNARSVRARVEIMRGDLLTDGKVTLAELGGMEADYGVPAEHIVSAATAWTDPAADILGDIRAWSKVYRGNNGFNPGGMVLSTDRLSNILQNTAMRNLLANTAGAPPILTNDQLNALLSAYGLPGIRFVYDAMVIDDSNTAVNILPADRVVFVPPAGVELGYTQWGMTATGLELQRGNGGVQAVPSPAGMVACVDKDPRPPYHETAYVDATAMPVLSRPRGLFVADVAA